MRSLWAGLGLTLGSISVFLGALFSNCIPSLLTVWCAVAVTILIGIYAIIRELQRPINSVEQEQGTITKAGMLSGSEYIFVLRPILRVLIPPFFAYVTCTETLPWLYNLQFGTNGQMSVTVTGWADSSRISCHRPTFEEAPLLLSRAMCMQSFDEARFPIGGKVLLTGKSSSWGINVTDAVAISESP